MRYLKGFIFILISVYFTGGIAVGIQTRDRLDNTASYSSGVIAGSSLAITGFISEVYRGDSFTGNIEGMKDIIDKAEAAGGYIESSSNDFTFLTSLASSFYFMKPLEIDSVFFMSNLEELLLLSIMESHAKDKYAYAVREKSKVIADNIEILMHDFRKLYYAPLVEIFLKQESWFTEKGAKEIMNELSSRVKNVDRLTGAFLGKRYDLDKRKDFAGLFAALLDYLVIELQEGLELNQQLIDIIEENTVLGEIQDVDKAKFDISAYIVFSKYNLQRLKNLRDDVVRNGLHPVNVCDYIENIAAYINSNLSKEIEIITELPNDAVVMDISYFDLDSIMLTLIDNAMRSIFDREIRGRKPDIVITLWVESSNVKIKVEDAGTGIPGDVLARIFEDGFTTKDDGIGRGLYIIRSKIEGYGGDIRAESVLGEGTVFKISLPISTSSPLKHGGVAFDKGVNSLISASDSLNIYSIDSNVLSGSSGLIFEIENLKEIDIKDF